MSNYNRITFKERMRIEAGIYAMNLNGNQNLKILSVNDIPSRGMLEKMSQETMIIRFEHENTERLEIIWKNKCRANYCFQQ